MFSINFVDLQIMLHLELWLVRRPVHSKLVHRVLIAILLLVHFVVSSALER